jgi:RHS repeat-associated protein
MTAAYSLDRENEPLSQKPPLGEKRPRLRLVWENPALSAGTHKEKSEAKPDSSYGRVLYNYFRDYDPSTGRYITADPLGVIPDPRATLSNLNHLYVYANNNPVNLADPYGLLPGMPWPEFGPVCGSGSSAGFVPDGPFKDACRKHDECYGTCGKTKEQCDLELCTNGACLYGFLLDGALSGPSQSAYHKAQKESGCDDCNK